MAAIYSAFSSGVITDNPLASGATTFNSTALAGLPTVAAPNTMWIVLDPNGVGGLPEIVQVTTHTAAATVATIVRGQQTSQGGAAAHAHVLNTVWVAAQTPSDFDQLDFRLVTTKGDLISATGANAVARFAAGADQSRLVADSAQTSGLRWAPNTENNIVTAKGDLIVATASNTLARHAVGANGTALVADSTQTNGMRWGSRSSLTTSAITAGGSNSGGTTTISLSSTLAAIPGTGVWMVQGHLLVAASGGPVTVDFMMNSAAGDIGGARIDLLSTQNGTMSASGAIAAANAVITVTFKVTYLAGTGTITWSGDSRYTRLDAIYLAD